MKKLSKLFAAAFALSLAFGLSACKTDTQIEPSETPRVSAVTFKTAATEKGVSVSMQTETEGAEIRYTTNETTPTKESVLYEGAVEVTSDTTFMAVGFKDGMEQSLVSYAKVSVTTKTITEEKTVPEEPSEGKTLEIGLSSSVKYRTNGEEKTSVTVTATIKTQGTVKNVVYKKDGSINAAALLADTDALKASEDSGDNTKWTFTIELADESSEGTYTVAAVDNQGRRETSQLEIKGLISFVALEGGTFKYTDENALSPESKVFISGREITIGGLLVCDHETTQKEYETYCVYRYSGKKPNETYGIGDNFPAYFVSWYDAVIYCNLRSIAEKLNPVYSISGETDPSKWPGISSETADGTVKYCGPSLKDTDWETMTFNTDADGYRLPTAAEWEYIARGKNKETFTYSGSDTVGDVAWYKDNSENKTHEVKQKTANSLGIYDMSGNVSEWCWDWYSSSITTSTPATGAASGDWRVFRGGSWKSSSTDSTSVSYLSYTVPYNRYEDYGFRVVRNAN